MQSLQVVGTSPSGKKKRTVRALSIRALKQSRSRRSSASKKQVKVQSWNFEFPGGRSKGSDSGRRVYSAGLVNTLGTKHSPKSSRGFSFRKNFKQPRKKSGARRFKAAPPAPMSARGARDVATLNKLALGSARDYGGGSRPVSARARVVSSSLHEPTPPSSARGPVPLLSARSAIIDEEPDSARGPPDSARSAASSTYGDPPLSARGPSSSDSARGSAGRAAAGASEFKLVPASDIIRKSTGSAFVTKIALAEKWGLENTSRALVPATLDVAQAESSGGADAQDRRGAKWAAQVKTVDEWTSLSARGRAVGGPKKGPAFRSPAVEMEMELAQRLNEIESRRIDGRSGSGQPEPRTRTAWGDVKEGSTRPDSKVQDYELEKFQVFRELFRNVILHDKSYGHLLEMIRNSYESRLPLLLQGNSREETLEEENQRMILQLTSARADCSSAVREAKELRKQVKELRESNERLQQVVISKQEAEDQLREKNRLQIQAVTGESRSLAVSREQKLDRAYQENSRLKLEIEKLRTQIEMERSKTAEAEKAIVDLRNRLELVDFAEQNLKRKSWKPTIEPLPQPSTPAYPKPLPRTSATSTFQRSGDDDTLSSAQSMVPKIQTDTADGPANQAPASSAKPKPLSARETAAKKRYQPKSLLSLRNATPAGSGGSAGPSST